MSADPSDSDEVVGYAGFQWGDWKSGPVGLAPEGQDGPGPWDKDDVIAVPVKPQPLGPGPWDDDEVIMPAPKGPSLMQGLAGFKHGFDDIVNALPEVPAEAPEWMGAVPTREYRWLNRLREDASKMEEGSPEWQNTMREAQMAELRLKGKEDYYRQKNEEFRASGMSAQDYYRDQETELVLGDWRHAPWFIRGLGEIPQHIGGRLLSMLQRVTGYAQEADKTLAHMNRQAEAHGFADRDAMMGEWAGYPRQALTAAGESAAVAGTTVLSGGAALPGLLAYFGASATNSGYHEGKALGLSGASLHSFAAAKGVTEAALTYAFARITGNATMTGQLSEFYGQKTVARAAGRAGLTGAIGRLFGTGFSEAAEETTITAAHALIDRYMGGDKTALRLDRLGPELRDTAIIAFLAGTGTKVATHLADAALESMAPPIDKRLEESIRDFADALSQVGEEMEAAQAAWTAAEGYEGKQAPPTTRRGFEAATGLKGTSKQFREDFADAVEQRNANEANRLAAEAAEQQRLDDLDPEQNSPGPMRRVTSDARLKFKATPDDTAFLERLEDPAMARSILDYAEQLYQEEASRLAESRALYNEQIEAILGKAKLGAFQRAVNRASDPAAIPRFDEIVHQFAEYAPHLLGRALSENSTGTAEEAVFELLKNGAKQFDPPQRYRFLDDAMEEAAEALGVPRVLEEVGAETMEHPAYHGSGKKFNRFSMEYLGTGEGAQAYGHGLYFSGSKDVADYYRNRLSNPPDFNTPEGKAQWAMIDANGDRAKAEESLRDQLSIISEGLKRDQEILDGYKELLRNYEADESLTSQDPKPFYYTHALPEQIEAYTKRVEGRNDTIQLYTEALEALKTVDRPGALYKVDLKPDEETDYINYHADWDRQSEKVKAAVREILGYDPPSHKRGYDVYEEIANEQRRKVGNNQKATEREASRVLLKHGVRGMKHHGPPDGRDYYNYVIFDDADIAIEEVMESPAEPGGQPDRPSPRRRSEPQVDPVYEALETPTGTDDGQQMPINFGPSTPEQRRAKPVAARHVIQAAKRVMKMMGVKAPLRQGLMGGFERTARGIFKVHANVVRNRSYEDITTSLHELTHALQQAMMGTAKGSPWLPYKKKNDPTAGIAGLTSAEFNELVGLGKALYGTKTPAGGYAAEGFAEFVKFYVTDHKHATKQAPKFEKWFEAKIRKEFGEPTIDALLSLRERAEAWGNQPSIKRGESQIAPLSEILKTQLREATTPQQLIMAHVELLEPLAALEVLARANGRPAPKGGSAYEIAKGLRMVGPARLDFMVNHGMLSADLQVVGKPLTEAFASVKASQRKDFTLYLFARRALALWNDPKGEPRHPGMFKRDAEAIVRELHTLEFEQAAKAYETWNDQLWDYVSGLSPRLAELAQRIRDRDPGHYLPLSRVFTDIDKAYAGFRPNANGGTLVQHLRGANLPIKDPIPQILSNAAHLIDAAHNELVREEVFKLAEVPGMGPMIERVPRDTIPEHATTVGQVVEAIQRKLAAEGLPVDVGLLDVNAANAVLDPMLGLGKQAADTALTLFGRAIVPKHGRPIVPRVVDGRVEWFYLDKNLFEALGGREPSLAESVARHWASKPLRMSNEIFRAGTTGLSLQFQFWTNPDRDLVEFMQNTQFPWRQAVPAYFKGLRDSALFAMSGGTIVPESVKLFRMLGLPMATPLGEDMLTTRNLARRLFAADKPIHYITHTPVDASAKVWNYIRENLQLFEGAPRLAEVQMIAKREGWKPGQPLPIGLATQMLLGGKEVTVDFTAAGHFSRAMNQLVPFYNVTFQGPRASIRAFRRNPKLYLARGLVRTGMAVGLWWAYKDEEWWNELDDREKVIYWHIPTTNPFTGREELLRIPRTYESDFAFSGLPVAMLEAWYKQDPGELGRFMHTLWDTAGPHFTPPLVETSVELYRNKDSFTQRPIVSRSLDNRDAVDQHNEYTSEVAKFIGRSVAAVAGRDAAAASPAQIDHAIRGIGGRAPMDLINLLGIGNKISRQVDPISSTIFRRGGMFGTRPKTVEKLYDAFNEAERAKNRPDKVETSEERQRRLMLQDASKAVTGLFIWRASLDDENERRATTEKALEVAKQALHATQAGPMERAALRRERRAAERLADEAKRQKAAASSN